MKSWSKIIEIIRQENARHFAAPTEVAARLYTSRRASLIFWRQRGIFGPGEGAKPREIWSISMLRLVGFSFMTRGAW